MRGVEGIPAKNCRSCQSNFKSTCASPSTSNIRQRFQHDQPVFYLYTATCNIPFVFPRTIGIAIVTMSVDAQGPPNEPNGRAPPIDKSAERDATEHEEAQHDATAAAVEEAPPQKPQPKLCGICEKGQGKYKCPRCSIP